MGQQVPETMGLLITSIVMILTDNHTLGDQSHQGHHRTLMQSETLLFAAHASLCGNEVRSLEPGLCMENFSRRSRPLSLQDTD